MSQHELALGISVMTQCHNCLLLDSVCQDCEDSRQANDANIAHAIVDEGNLQYSIPLTYNLPQESGHDWVGAVTRTYRDKERNEFLEPITVITDRIFDMGFDMPANSIVCQDCHYTYNKHTTCPNCN